jgi:hypothetical protein
MNIAWRVMRRDRRQMLSRMNLRITGNEWCASSSRKPRWIVGHEIPVRPSRCRNAPVRALPSPPTANASAR